MLLPDSFVNDIRLLLGEEASKVLNAIEMDPVVSIRLNPSKAVPCTLDDAVPWATNAFYLKQRQAFTFDPLFHAGCYYVQEASSMFVEQAVCQHITGPVNALDLCAAPGGKSTLLRSILPSGSLLVSNELIPSRAQILAENMMKWGYSDHLVTCNPPADFARMEGFFDLLLTDVPCSGEGMFRKDPIAVEEWSEQNIGKCVQRGRNILRDIWPALKPGGILIYSTCTFNTHEDEEQVRWICDELGAEPLSVSIKEEWDITGDLSSFNNNKDKIRLPVYRFLPGRTRGEGFFLAVLRKNETAICTPTKNKGRSRSKTASIPTDCKAWIQNPDEYDWQMDGNTIIAIPHAFEEQISLLRQNLRILHTGITVADIKGRDLIPQQSLAHSIDIQRSAFPTVELCWSDALTYLRGETIVLPSDTPRGKVLLSYDNVPIGFAKNIGNRANNLYPQEWRIHTTHLPNQQVHIIK